MTESGTVIDKRNLATAQSVSNLNGRVSNLSKTTDDVKDIAESALKVATIEYAIGTETEATGEWQALTPKPGAGEYVWQRVTVTTGAGKTTQTTSLIQNIAALAQSTADTAKEKASAAQSTADTAKENAATAQSTADSAKKDAATAQSTADTAKSDAATAQTTADSANTAASKAQSTADGAQKTASQAVSAASNANSKIDNMQIGGRNLLVGGSGLERTVSYPSSGYVNYVIWYDVTLPPETDFVLSFDAKASDAGNIMSSYFYNPANLSRVESSQGTVGSGWVGDGFMRTKLTTEWKRYWIHYTGPVAASRNVLALRLFAGDGTGTVSIRKIKFELGNKATDWTPAPEDTDSAVADAKKAGTDAQTTADAAQTTAEAALTDAVIEYALGDSADTAPESGWSSETPEWISGKYIWQKTTVKDGKGNKKVTTTCIQGAKGEDAILLQIDSANGTQFKNTGVSTTLTVTIRYGDKIITKAADMLENFGSAAYLTWSEKKLGETEFTALASDDSRIGDSGFYLTLGTDDVDEKSVFECELNF